MQRLSVGFRLVQDAARIVARVLLLLSLVVVGCESGVAKRSRQAAALEVACDSLIAASDGDDLPEPMDPDGGGGNGNGQGNGQGNGNAGGASQLLSALGDPSPHVRDRAALRVLRKAPDYGDGALLLAETVVGDLADWRADPALVRILRNRFPSSARTFSPSVRANAALALGLITEKGRGTPPNPGHGAEHGGEGAAPLPDYLYRAVSASACPPSSVEIRQASTRALGQLRDTRAVDLLRLIEAAPSTGDDVQDALLSFTAARALTMVLPENAVTSEVTEETQDALTAFGEALADAAVAP